MNNQVKIGWWEKILWWEIVLYLIVGFFIFLLIIDLGVSLYLNFFCPDIDYFIVHYPWGNWYVKNYCGTIP